MVPGECTHDEASAGKTCQMRDVHALGMQLLPSPDCASAPVGGVEGGGGRGPGEAVAVSQRDAPQPSPGVCCCPPSVNSWTVELPLLKPDVMAPGVDIIMATDPSTNQGDGYKMSLGAHFCSRVAGVCYRDCS